MRAIFRARFRTVDSGTKGTCNMGELETFIAAMLNDHERLGQLCSRVTDWHALLEQASRHGIEGVLYHDATALQRILPKEVERLLNVNLPSNDSSRCERWRRSMKCWMP